MDKNAIEFLVAAISLYIIICFAKWPMSLLILAMYAWLKIRE